MAFWLSSHLSQVLSPSSLLKTRITGISPKTSNRRTREFTCQALVLPPNDYSVDLRFSGSIATPPPESDLDDEQIRVLCWLHHCTYMREKQMRNDHPERENLMFSSSQDPTTRGTGKLVALFSSKHRLNQVTFSDREDLPLRHQQVFGSNEHLFRFSNPENVAKSLLDENRDHMPAEARSELMK